MKYLILMLFLVGCQPVSKKPFLITYKNCNPPGCNQDKACWYSYTDANGKTGNFCDTIFYKVGDVIE